MCSQVSPDTSSSVSRAMRIFDDKCGIVFNQQNVYSNVQILKIKHQNVRAASYTINNTNVGFLICPHMDFI